MAKSRLCSIEGCGKQHVAKSFCRKHYVRLRVTGDPLCVKIRAKGETTRFYRNVVLNYEDETECLIWPFSRTEGGYGAMKTDDGITGVVSRRLCEEIYGPPPTLSHHAAHSCGNGKRGCVSKHHIAWKTKAENEREKLKHGTHNRGERHGNSRLTEAQALEILALKDVEQKKLIAKRFGISATTVSYIHQGKRWSWLQSNETS